MKRILIASLATLFLSSISLAQNSTQQAAQAPAQAQTQDTNRPTRLSPGSVIPVQLTQGIDAKKLKSGDEVVAKVTEDLKSTKGEVIVPKDTKVVGHVTAAQPRSKERKESDVGIAFDHAVLKDGSEIKMPLSIQAIIAPPNTNPSNAASGRSNDQSAGTQSGGGGMPQGGGNAGRTGGMGGSTAASQPTAPTANTAPDDTQTANNTHAPITTKTQGVVGISNLKLTTAAPNPGEGSVVSSEKNNVKLESGTFLLLRVD